MVSHLSSQTLIEFEKMVGSELPEEILIDVFSRLPAKSVERCRCLSKRWNDILSSPQFIKVHLNRKPHQQSLLLVDRSRSIHSIATIIPDDAVSRKLRLPFGCREILGSCDGLVLLVDKEGNKVLLNPLTLEREIMPNLSLALKDEAIEMYRIHGFGLDSSIDDYKIVTLWVEDIKEEDDYDQAPKMFVDVYLVKRGVSKRVKGSPYGHAFPCPHHGAFFNGAIHWLAMNRKWTQVVDDDSESSYQQPVLLAFSLSDEVFSEIPAPPDFDKDHWAFAQVLVLGGFLCIIDRENAWMMKEYGLVESWTKLTVDIPGQWGRWMPLCFVGDQEIVSIVRGRNFSFGVYSQKERTLRNMIVNGIIAFFDDGVMFEPSLVSPAYVDKAYYESLSVDPPSEVNVANLTRILTNQSIPLKHLQDYRTIISSLEHTVRKYGEEKAELESELRKRKRALSVLTRAHKKSRTIKRRLLEKLAYERRRGQKFLSSNRGKAYRVDSSETVVRRCRCRGGSIAAISDVEVATHAEGAGSGGCNFGC